MLQNKQKSMQNGLKTITIRPATITHKMKTYGNRFMTLDLAMISYIQHQKHSQREQK
jgi:hypothetical protein